jgi:hypothetical protein
MTDGFPVPGGLEDPSALARLDLEQIERVSGCGAHLSEAGGLASVIQRGLKEWRVNPGRSFVRGMEQVGSASAGDDLFRSSLDQSLFLASLMRCGAMPAASIQVAVAADGKRVQENQGLFRLGVAEKAIPAFVSILGALRLWRMANEARIETGSVRLPKRLYRGIRGRDIHVDIPSIGDEHHLVRSMRVTEDRFRRMSDVPLHSVSTTGILSFTELRGAAQHFANEEGFVIEIDPRDVGIVSSWTLDLALSGKDEMTGRSEREWIVQVPPDLVLQPDQVAIEDGEYSIVTRDPLGVGRVSHDYQCRYSIDGRHIRSSFVYNSNGVGGKVVFHHKTAQDAYGQHSRRTFKRIHGFDPVPDDPSRVSDIEYLKVESWSGKVTRLPHVEPGILRHPVEEHGHGSSTDAPLQIARPSARMA